MLGPLSHAHHNSSAQSNSSPLQILTSFLSTRRSNDIYDTFSMQIASYIQNHLNKSNPSMQHNTFDSHLLAQLEPIFFSFLKYTTKLSLKQKTLQAWNGTFGKSADERLHYTQRLEKLFIELKEEMINKSRVAGSSSMGCASNLIALSLPGLKPFDLMHHTNTNTTNSLNNENLNDSFKSEVKAKKNKDEIAMLEEDKENSNTNNINLNSNSNNEFGAKKQASIRDLKEIGKGELKSCYLAFQLC
jgi:hypothetical protein